MPWYPGARRHDVRRDRGFPGRGSARRITPIGINHHTAVVNRDDLDRQANDLSKAYPHFMVGRDGEIVQYQDTDFMARADLDGNPYYISIETWDGYPNGAPGYWRHNSDVPPWNPKQLRALIALDAWILENHPSIPLRLARDSKPGESSKGLSWHRLGIDGTFPNQWPYWGRRVGGRRYSNAFGKACAGDRRIQQVVEVIYPALTNGRVPVAGPTARPDVEVQLVLAVLGHYDAGADLKWLDGINGPGQQAAVADYQRKHGLTPDGWWGTNTDKHFEENVMASVVQEIAAAVAGFTRGDTNRDIWARLTRVEDRSEKTNAAVGTLAVLVPQIAEKVGAPVDIDEFAKTLAPALVGPLVEAVTAAGGQITEAVVERGVHRAFAGAFTDAEEA